MKRVCTLIVSIVFICIQNNAYGQLWKQYSDSAKVFSDQKKIDKAIEYYIKAKEELHKDSTGSESYVLTCNNLANSYIIIRQYAKAEPLYFEAKQICGKMFGKEHPVYSSSCIGLVLLYYYMGKYEKAEPICIEVKQISEKIHGKEHPDYASCCNRLGALYNKMGQYSKAELLWEEAKQIREKTLGKEHTDYASSCSNLAILYNKMGQYEKAEPLFLEAKKIKEKAVGKKHTDYASCCINLATFYLNMGQYEKAEPLYAEAKQIQEEILGKEDPAYAVCCNNLANLYRTMRQYEKAEPLFLEARLVWEKTLGKEHPDYAISSINLGNLYMDMGQYEKAEPFFVENKYIIEKALGKDHPDYASGCNDLASIYTSMGQFEKAEPFFIEAKKIRERVLGREHPYYVKSCNNLGDLYVKMGQFKKAETCFAEALDLRRSQVQKIFQFTSEAEKRSYLGESTEDNNVFYSYKYSENSSNRHGFTYDVSLFSRMSILSSSQQLRSAIYNTSDKSIKKMYATWISLREQISFWNVKPIADRPEYVKNLEEQANTLEKELTRLSSDFKNQLKKTDITWRNIQENLKIHEAAIEFVEFNYYTGKRWTDSTYYIAVVLRKDKPQPILVRLFEKKLLDTMLNSTENLETEKKISALYAGNKSLYDLAWKPLEKYLTGISKVYFASAGNLFKISFAALPVNDKQVLGDKYKLIQLNTTATVTDNTQSFITATDKIQLYGGIRYDADSVSLKNVIISKRSASTPSGSLPTDLKRGEIFKYLPGTQQEIEEIKKQAGNINSLVTVQSGINATEESIKALTGKNSPSVLHIATHGFFFPDPKDDKRDSVQRKFETSGKVFKQSDNPLFRSGLLFAGANYAWEGNPINGIEDGILTAYEVSNLYLPNTKLVVLSACETALGDIQGSEGVYGLQRAFKMAGVQNLVMSLWKVPDAETSEFMQIFYKNLFARQTISNAFYNAQQIMKNKYRAEPYKWAAWVLVR